MFIKFLITLLKFLITIFGDLNLKFFFINHLYNCLTINSRFRINQHFRNIIINFVLN